MSRLWLVGDLHLGHKNILRYRPDFSSLEEHDGTLVDNIATVVGKRDTIYFMGDTAFTEEGLAQIEQNVRAKHKVLILGNHDLERGLSIPRLLQYFDRVEALYAKRKCWFSHCPIHPAEMRNKDFNIHGHVHGQSLDDPRYINVCPEMWNWMPVTFDAAIAYGNERLRGSVE